MLEMSNDDFAEWMSTQTFEDVQFVEADDQIEAHIEDDVPLNVSHNEPRCRLVPSRNWQDREHTRLLQKWRAELNSIGTRSKDLVEVQVNVRSNAFLAVPGRQTCVGVGPGDRAFLHLAFKS